MTKVSGLQVIIDVETTTRFGWSPRDLAAACLDGSARLLQIRAKEISSASLLRICDEIVRTSDTYGAKVIVNDRVDLALMCGAAGVHLGQEDLRPTVARKQLGKDALIGLSTHLPVQIELALQAPINYVAIGPVFETSTKPTSYKPLGLEGVHLAAKKVHKSKLPIVAIGGISLEQARGVFESGADAVAIISDVFVGNDPADRVRKYLDLFRPSPLPR